MTRSTLSSRLDGLRPASAADQVLPLATTEAVGIERFRDMTSEELRHIARKLTTYAGIYTGDKEAREMAARCTEVASVLEAAERQSVETALRAIPENVYWLLAKGRVRPQEPLYAIQLLKPGTEYVIAEAEGDSIQECVDAALSRSKAKGG